MYYGHNYLPQYGFGDWLKSNAGTVGGVAGGVGGFFIGGPAGAMAGASIGGAIGGGIQGKYEQNEMADDQAERMAQMQQQQAYQNKLSLANQKFSDQNLPQNRMFSGTQNFAFGGKIGNKDTTNSGINYNQYFPQKSKEGEDYYITRRTSETMANPNLFKPFTDNYVAFTDSTLIPNYGNIRGFDTNDAGKIFFNSNTEGDSSKFKEAFDKKISINDLLNGLDSKACGGKLGKRANGGDLENYSGQTHLGPQGGIEVDAQGTPTVMSGEQPTALVEDGEVNWSDPDSGEVYIFSNRLSRK